MQFIEASAYSVRSAVWVLRRGQTPLRFQLFPMVHIGSQAFYDDVARRVARCDVIVAEGSGDEPPPEWVTALRIRLYRRFHRLRSSDLVYQNVDYRAMGAPVIWPDLAPPAPDRPKRPLKHRLLFAGLLIALPFIALFMLARGGAKFLEGQSGLNVEDSSLDDLREGPLDEMVLRDRDVLLIEALNALHEERQMESIDVAVVYGAMHMPRVLRHLVGAYGYRPGGAEWLTVYGAHYDRPPRAAGSTSAGS